jgi:hypothetical protein
MFNFDFFGRKKYDTKVLETPLWQVPIIPDRPAETGMSDSGYTVGVDNDAQTVLKVSCNGSTITLTMGEASVVQLIRLLKATLPEQDDEEDSQHNDTTASNRS